MATPIEQSAKNPPTVSWNLEGRGKKYGNVFHEMCPKLKKQKAKMNLSTK